MIEYIQETLTTEANELLAKAEHIDEAMLNAVALIEQTKGKVIVIGVGKSGLVGAKISATLASTGTPSFFIHPTEALHGDLGMIGKEDLVIAISYSGESEELIKILPHIKKMEVKLIAMTNSATNSLASFSDAFVDISVQKEACPLNIAPTSSTTLTMALGDALAVALMKRRDFRQEDFASLHPGGSLGKKLFVKIKDLAHYDHIPTIEESATIKEAILSMTQNKLGHTIIVDKAQKILAIISDGDLRRALMDENFSTNDLALFIATKAPFVIDDEELLASETLKVFKEKKIQLIPIVDSTQKVIATLHIHDIIKAGIK